LPLPTLAVFSLAAALYTQFPRNPMRALVIFESDFLDSNFVYLCPSPSPIIGTWPNLRPTEELMARTNGSGSSPRTKSKSSNKKLSTQEQIQLRAYEIYLERNGAPGNPTEDWVRAEREVLASTAAKAAKPKRTGKKTVIVPL